MERKINDIYEYLTSIVKLMFMWVKLTKIILLNIRIIFIFGTLWYIIRLGDFNVIN